MTERLVETATQRFGRLDVASDEAGFITGTVQLIDGGASTKRYPDILARLGEMSL